MIMEETRRRSYTIIEPQCTWSRAEDCDTLTVDVSGFKEEQLRVLANTRRKLKISGERHLDGKRWARFVKEFRIPRSCHVKGIKATFNKEDQVLNIMLPKSTRQVESQDQPTQVSGPPMDQKTSEKTESSDSQARKAADEKNLEGSSEGAVQRTEQETLPTKNERDSEKMEESIKGEQETLPTKNERDSAEMEESIKGEQETLPTKNERDSGKRDEEFTKENDKPTVNERDSRKREEEITKENEKPTENERDSRQRDEEFAKENETSQEANASKKPRKWYSGLVRWFNKIKLFMLYVVVPVLIIVGVGTYLM